MTEKEKILLLQLLLIDMRGSFPVGGWEDKRMIKARDLAIELGLEKHQERIRELAEDEEDDYKDGRHFRCDVALGGYEGMSVLHGLDLTFHDKPIEFRKAATS